VLPVIHSADGESMHDLLRADGRDADAVCAMVKACCRSALDRE
jgi:hypothetical protein